MIVSPTALMAATPPPKVAELPVMVQSSILPPVAATHTPPPLDAVLS
jgi:hypothetical protein